MIAWAAQIGTITFHPWPVRRDDADHPTSCASTSTRSPAPTSPTRLGWPARRAAAARGARHPGLPEDLGQPRRPHLPPDRTAVGLHRRTARRDRVRPGARAADAGAGDHQLVEGGARRGGSSSTSTRTPATGPSPVPTALRPQPGGPVSTPVDVGRAGGGRVPGFTLWTVPERFADVGDLHADIDDVHHSLQPLLDLYDATWPAGAARCRTRRTTRRCRASRLGCSRLGKSLRTGKANSLRSRVDRAQLHTESSFGIGRLADSQDTLARLGAVWCCCSFCPCEVQHPASPYRRRLGEALSLTAHTSTCALPHPPRWGAFLRGR